MGEGLGWGCLLNLSRDTVSHAIGIPERIPIADTQNPIALRTKPRVPLGVVKLRIRQVMSPTIDLDHQLCAMMDEIDDVAPHGSLTPDVEIELAKRFPQDALASGHFPP